MLSRCRQRRLDALRRGVGRFTRLLTARYRQAPPSGQGLFSPRKAGQGLWGEPLDDASPARTRRQSRSARTHGGCFSMMRRASRAGCSGDRRHHGAEPFRAPRTHEAPRGSGCRRRDRPQIPDSVRFRQSDLFRERGWATLPRARHLPLSHRAREPVHVLRSWISRLQPQTTGTCSIGAE